ncbi:MAG TPA: hypothetical protein VLR93_07770 [Patescibacteria group bacterium]|nr:hypothetical protein [Patescibacteria group bacterium]
MDTPKETYRNVEESAKKTLRDVDGHDLTDDIGNAGDEIRKDLGNAGDQAREGIDKAGDEAKDWTEHEHTGPDREPVSPIDR